MPEHAHLRLVPSEHSPCAECRLRARCLPDHMGEEETALLSGAIRALPPVARGTALFHQGAPMTAFFFVRSGSAKSVVGDSGGHEAIMSFLLPSDIVGVASLDQTVYHDTVIALERSSFCAIAADDLQRLCATHPHVQHAFFGKLANRVSYERHARIRLEHHSADQRVADFIVELSGRFGAIDRDPDQLYLPMSRYDIGSYLALAPETVSRALSRFGQAGVIHVRHKELTILDREQLEAIATEATQS
ncbi:MAG: Crp/Fnr family transcriptional regulator [Gammaproteobacteria bacterium]